MKNFVHLHLHSEYSLLGKMGFSVQINDDVNGDKVRDNVVYVDALQKDAWQFTDLLDTIEFDGFVAPSTDTSSEETSSVEETTSEEVTSEETTSETATETTSSEATSSEEDEDADRNVAVVDVNNTSLTEATIEAITGLAVGEQTLVKDTYQYLIVEGLNVLEDAETVEDYTSTARTELKGEEFEEYISTLAKDVEVELNQEAFDRYNPKKIKMQ